MLCLLRINWFETVSFTHHTRMIIFQLLYGFMVSDYLMRIRSHTKIHYFRWLNANNSSSGWCRCYTFDASIGIPETSLIRKKHSTTKCHDKILSRVVKPHSHIANYSHIRDVLNSFQQLIIEEGIPITAMATPWIAYIPLTSDVLYASHITILCLILQICTFDHLMMELYRKLAVPPW